MKIRPIAPADHEILLEMNNAAVPAVNALDAPTFATLVSQCELALVVEEDTVARGFLLALMPGTDYDSENYRWFEGNERGFCYLDRIVVAADSRDKGIGEALHAELVEHLRVDKIALEVNLRPANPGSLRFHHRLGFVEVGQLHTESGKLVSLMTRTLR